MAEDIEVLFSKGKVFVDCGEGISKELKIGMSVTEDCIITTGKNSFAILKIRNHSTHKIEEETEIIVHKLPYFFEDSNHLEQGSIIELINGIILSEIQRKSGTETLKIISNKTSFGVRGTRFLVSKDKEDHLLVSVNRGQVEVSGPDAMQRDFLEKSDSLEIIKSKKFQKRQKYNFSKKIEWNILSRDETKHFSEIRSLAKDELKKRRQKWIKDPRRIEKFKKQWEARKKEWSDKTKNFKSSKRLKNRKEVLKIKRKTIPNQKLNKDFLKTEDKTTLKERFQKRRNDLKSTQKKDQSKVREKIKERRRKKN